MGNQSIVSLHHAWKYIYLWKNSSTHSSWKMAAQKQKQRFTQKRSVKVWARDRERTKKWHASNFICKSIQNNIDNVKKKKTLRDRLRSLHMEQKKKWERNIILIVMQPLNCQSSDAFCITLFSFSLIYNNWRACFFCESRRRENKQTDQSNIEKKRWHEHPHGQWIRAQLSMVLLNVISFERFMNSIYLHHSLLNRIYWSER